METGINLLPEVAEKEIKEGVYKRKVNVVTLVTLMVMGLIVVGLIVYQLVLSVSASDLQNKTTDAEQKVSKYSSVEIENQAVKEKLDKIRQLLNSAIPGSTLISEVTKTGSPVIIKGVSLADNSTVTVTGTANGSNALGNWINNLTTGEGQDYFDRINLVSLTGGIGGYDFSVSMHYLKKGIGQ